MLVSCGPHRPLCLVSDTHNPREAAGKGPEMPPFTAWRESAISIKVPDCQKTSSY